MTKAKKLNVTHEGAETEYFRFYKSFLDAMRGYDDEIQFRAFKFIANYGIYGIVPELRDGDVASTIFLLCKPYIDSAYRRAKNGQEHKAKTELEEAEPQEPRKRGRPKKAAAAPDETPEADTAVIPLLEPAEEEAPVKVPEPSDPVKEDELLIDDATKEEELTLSDLRITPQKEKQQKKKFGENGYVRLTDEDYEDLVKNKGKELTDAAIDIYDCWLAAQSESKRKAELKKDHKFNLQVWPFQRAEEDLRKNAEKKAAGSGKVVPILPPANKNNFLNFEQNTLSAEEMQEFEAKLLEN